MALRAILPEITDYQLPTNNFYKNSFGKIKISPKESIQYITSNYSPEYLSSISIQEPTVKATSAQYTGSSRTRPPSLTHQS